jgi:hypothetical protein
LTCLGDSKAFLLLISRVGGRGNKSERHQGSCSSSNQGTLVHLDTPKDWKLKHNQLDVVGLRGSNELVVAWSLPGRAFLHPHSTFFNFRAQKTVVSAKSTAMDRPLSTKFCLSPKKLVKFKT